MKSGDKLNRFTLLESYRKGNRTWWKVMCDCGILKEVREIDLTYGATKSCGCLRRERFFKHGDSVLGLKLYRIWKAMWTRCTNPNGKSYKDYGSRGITVCEEWKDYKVFKDWAIASGYRDDLTIERIDNDGNYEPGNCKWILLPEQQLNTRKSFIITAFGETKVLAEWARDPRCKVTASTLKFRLDNGLSPEQAITLDKLLDGHHRLQDVWQPQQRPD